MKEIQDVIELKCVLADVQQTRPASNPLYIFHDLISVVSLFSKPWTRFHQHRDCF